MLALALVVILAGLIAAFRSSDEMAETAPRTTVKLQPGTMSQEEMLARVTQARSAEPIDPGEEALYIIEEYRERLEGGVEEHERPALLQTMGNMYRHKLLDYENAAWCYQQIILHYPDWDGAPHIYADLATCYERLGDHDNVLRTYMEMMRVLPDDSQEYLYAKEKLGL